MQVHNLQQEPFTARYQVTFILLSTFKSTGFDEIAEDGGRSATREPNFLKQVPAES